MSEIDMEIKDREDVSSEGSEGKKGLKKTFLAAVVSVIAALLILFTCKALVDSGKEDRGLCNMYNSTIGVVNGNYLYHASVDGTAFYKTSIKDGTQVVLAEGEVAFVSAYKNDIYYYNATDKKILRHEEDGEDVVLYDGEGYYPQFAGNYMYYMTPDESYGGFIHRVSLSGGEAETVLTVPCSMFKIEGKEILYFDPQITSLVKVSLKDAMKAAESGEKTTSASLMAEVLVEGVGMNNVNVTKKAIYYTDISDENRIYVYNRRNGETLQLNRGAKGEQLNVYGNYIYYVSQYDRQLYRMDLDGSDIRNLTRGYYSQAAGPGLENGYLVYYALVGYYNENMQIQYNPVIVVADENGKRFCEIPGIEHSKLEEIPYGEDLDLE